MAPTATPIITPRTNTRQATWRYATEAMTDAGRAALLRRYGVLRRAHVPRDMARVDIKATAHGVWMAKRGGW